MQRRRTTESARLVDGFRVGAERISERYGESIRATSVAAEFRKSLIFTGDPSIDLLLRPTFGSRITIVGEKHMGKTANCYRMIEAVQRTCRICLTPIIDFMNDDTGELATTCKCGANDPCSVVYFDLENEFDPAWAQTLGVDIGGTFSKDDPTAGDFEEEVPGLHVSPNAKFAVCRVTSAEQAATMMESLMEISACDLLVLDSIASMAPAEAKKGRQQPGALARALSIAVKKLLAAQSQAWIDEGVAPTFLATNQYRIKLDMMNPKADPRIPSGGQAFQYFGMQEWALHSKYNQGITDRTVSHQFADMTIKSKKDKQSGGTGSVAKTRLFLRDTTRNRLEYRAGETNAPEQLFEIVKEMAAATGDKRWYDKRSSKIIMLGREFKTAQAVKEFFRRRDIVYQLQLPVFSQLMELTGRAHLSSENYLYNPFENEPIRELIKESEGNTGEAAQQHLGRRSGVGNPAPRKAPKEKPKKPRASARGKKADTCEQESGPEA